MKRYLINQQIKADKVRLISEKGENLGIVSNYEALKKSIEANFDLIEISPSARPPVCKIADYNKFLYQERQKERLSSKKTHKIETKEFRFGPYIGDNDLNTKVERAKGFIAKKNSIKVTVVFKGREKAHPEIGKEKALKFIKEMGDLVKTEGAVEYKNGFINIFMSPN